MWILVILGIQEHLTHSGQREVVWSKWKFHIHQCIEKKLKKEANAFGKLFTTHDAREGFLAFLEKRLPDFKNK